MTFRQFFWRVIPWSGFLWLFLFIELQLWIIWFPDYAAMVKLSIIVFLIIFIIVLMYAVSDITYKTTLKFKDVKVGLP